MSTLRPQCQACHGAGHVCEDHPQTPWGGISTHPRACHCGRAGMPCALCCRRVPQDGTHSILEAFEPRDTA